MEAVETNKSLPWFIRAEQERLCPECGARMTEMDRLNEGNATFVWYKCIKGSCSGQWLARVPRPYYEISGRRTEMAGSSMVTI